MISLLLADDHRVIREGLRAILQKEKDLQILGEVADGLDAVEQAGKLKPAVLLLDLSLPRLHGLEVIRQVHKRSPDTRVVVLSMHANEAYVIESLRSGAAGYVLKDSSSADLVRAIHEVVAGRRFLSPPLSELAIQALLLRKSPDGEPDLGEILTEREREFLPLAANGLGNAEIAKRLFISPRTAEAHRANIFRKLNLKTQTDLVRFALRRGLIEL